MQKKIGNVIVDDTWYPGEDLYSDGEIEEKLLEISENCSEDELGDVIARERDWAVLYHMSSVRENIVRALPITKQDDVLEIGSGCGAVTGQLSRMAGSVTCVDLSMRRSLVNANRHRDQGNISILVGNFQEIEPHLDRKYDVITLIGVFEYARSYIGTDAPYEEFLRQISAHLKENGVLVIAIENRLGLKYWAGCREDHTGHLFDGIENYPDDQVNVHTFSRAELDAVAAKAGFAGRKFYYPYPDYKLPMEIFSDEYLPGQGQLGDNYWNFDRERLVLFDERLVFDSLVPEGQFPAFSNSFLVLLRREEADGCLAARCSSDHSSIEMKATGDHSEVSTKKKKKGGKKGNKKAEACAGNESRAGNESCDFKWEGNERLLYARFSTERGRSYALQTRILERGDGSRVVRKIPLYPEGWDHVRGIMESERRLRELFADTRLKVNAVEGYDAQTGAVDLAYVGGRTYGSAAAERKGAAGETRTPAGKDSAVPADSNGGRAQTLENRIVHLMGSGQREQALSLLHELMELVKSKAEETFSITEDFTRLFGLKEYPMEDRSLPVTDLDMLAENILLTEDGSWQLIDYEWTYAFPIPVRFLLFRIVHYLFAGMTQDTAPEEWYVQEGFSPQERALYLRMEAAWQRNLKQGIVPVRELYGAVSPGLRDVKAELSLEEGKPAEGYIATVTGQLSGSEQVRHLKLRTDAEGSFALSIPAAAVTDGRKLRWDPLENSLCRIRIERIDAPSLVRADPVNGFREGEWDAFWTLDPVYELSGEFSGMENIVIHGQLQILDPRKEMEAFAQTRRERDAYYTEMQALRAQVAAMKDTKAYQGVEVLRRGRNFTMARVRGTKLFRDRNAGPKRYQVWLKEHLPDEETLRAQSRMHLGRQPKISILVPVYRTPERYLRDMIESVLRQSYANWELCIADGSEEPDHRTAAIVREYAAKDPRIRLGVLKHNQGIAGNTNRAADLATGDYIALLDHDDMISADAMFEMAQAISQTGADVLYSDEDKVNMLGTDHFEPIMKPEFSPDLLRSHNYITHLFVVSRELFERVGRFREGFDGAQDHDLILRCTEQANRIVHIPRILYFWRSHEGSTAQNPGSKLYAYEAGARAVQEHLDRMHIPGKAERSKYWGLNHVKYRTPADAFVSIVIPNKDHVEDLRRCVNSILTRSAWTAFEILIVENNSEKEETFRYYRQLKAQSDKVRVLRWEKEFNYSAINNYAVRHAKGNYILLLNNDTELIEPGSIREMVGICARDDVGCVGAKLLYEDDTIQHAGIILGFGGFAGHVFTGHKKEGTGYMMRPLCSCNYNAVTAACMMIRRDVWEEAGGLCEDFAVALNDVDFCLRLREKGYLIVYTPYSLWHHYESRSRGYEDTPEKQERFQREIALFRSRWAWKVDQVDEYYNPNFATDRLPYTLWE